MIESSYRCDCCFVVTAPARLDGSAPLGWHVGRSRLGTWHHCPDCHEPCAVAGRCTKGERQAVAAEARTRG